MRERGREIGEHGENHKEKLMHLKNLMSEKCLYYLSCALGQGCTNKLQLLLVDLCVMNINSFLASTKHTAHISMKIHKWCLPPPYPKVYTLLRLPYFISMPFDSAKVIELYFPSPSLMFWVFHPLTSN